jgi:hypothetical protein
MSFDKGYLEDTLVKNLLCCQISVPARNLPAIALPQALPDGRQAVRRAGWSDGAMINFSRMKQDNCTGLSIKPQKDLVE